MGVCVWKDELCVGVCVGVWVGGWMRIGCVCGRGVCTSVYVRAGCVRRCVPVCICVWMGEWVCGYVYSPMRARVVWVCRGTDQSSEVSE